jgi:methylated-DNA-[protein]-cysteine S-methyltransferase
MEPKNFPVRGILYLAVMANEILISSFQSPFGELVLGSSGDSLCLCDWAHRKMREAIDQRIQRGLNATFREGRSSIIQRAIEQLEEYFHKDRKSFDLPLQWVGTEFQQRVWSALCEIPCGKTDTYLGLSRKLGDEGAIRAVAAANGANALAIIVPCHRVTGSDGSLTGYAGGISAKKKLLKLENAYLQRELDLFS